MKRIPPAPFDISPKDNKLTDRVARCNPNIYDGKYNLVELEEWIRGMEKIYTVIEVPNERKVNVGTFYLTREANI